MDALPQPMSVALPGLSAVRWSSDRLNVCMKEGFVAGRVVSGRRTYLAGGKEWDSGPGTLTLQQPGDVQRDLRRDGPGTLQLLSFAPQLVEAVTGAIRLPPQLSADDPRGQAFQHLHDAVAAGAERLILETAVAEALTSLRAVNDGRLAHTRPVRRALELLRERVDQPVALDELAAHAGLDKFRLVRAFRAQVGLPPHAYQTHLRIMRAKELLRAGVRASEIAPRIGFYDQSQLNRHFRRVVGTTPARYARGA